MKGKNKVKKNNNNTIKRKRNFLKETFMVNGKFDFIGLIKNIMIPVGGAILVAFITRMSMGVYNALKKSTLTPPNIVFPIVWIVLYILMGLAAYRIYMNNKNGKNDYDGYFCYLVQLLINLLWAIVFFNFRLYGISFILLITLLGLIIITTIKFLRVDKLAGYLMIPYILWVSFAGYLSFYVWMFNEM